MSSTEIELLTSKVNVILKQSSLLCSKSMLYQSNLICQHHEVYMLITEAYLLIKEGLYSAANCYLVRSIDLIRVHSLNIDLYTS